jgi:ATP-dependent DNA helicase RecG
MAPTEILAEQHYRKFARLADAARRQVAWLSGSLKKEEREAEALRGNRSGAAMLGRHPCAVPGTGRVRKLALAIVDEQHRFGVHQRLALRMKGGRSAKARCSRTS